MKVQRGFTVIDGDKAMTKRYTFFWSDGERQVLEGKNSTDALNRGGYCDDSPVRSLDVYMFGDNHDYIWDGGRWKRRSVVSAG